MKKVMIPITGIFNALKWIFRDRTKERIIREFNRELGKLHDEIKAREKARLEAEKSSINNTH